LGARVSSVGNPCAIQSSAISRQQHWAGVGLGRLIHPRNSTA
jgi:hypothetical protein